jgi:MoxR-like ATPase
MNLTPQDIEVLARLHQRVRLASRDFYNSSALASYPDPLLGHVFGDMQFTIIDIIQAAIITQTHVLLVGDTGTAKTDVLRMAATAAFGDQWFLLRLNPHLDEQTFADVDYKKLYSQTDGSSVRECIRPCAFLNNPLLVLDEVNRTPAALTNILLGYMDGTIELKFGIKQEVGYAYTGRDGQPRRYSLVVGTMNDGEEFEGTFGMDRALRNRFTLTIPLDSCRPTNGDLANVLLRRTGRAYIPPMASMIDEVVAISDRLEELPVDDLASLYLLYLANLDRCPNMPGGFKNRRRNPEVCMRNECRVFKQADGFCAYASATGLRVSIFLKRAATGLAALRAARTLRQVKDACDGSMGADAGTTLEALQSFSGCRARGPLLHEAVVKRYLSRLSVSVDEILALLPMAAGGKMCLAEEFVSKRTGGDGWQALRLYGTETYAWLEAFFRDNGAIFEELPKGNGAVASLRERLSHAEKFTDPFIRHVLEPFLDKIEQRRLPEQISEDMERREAIASVASLLTRAAGSDLKGAGAT